MKYISNIFLLTSFVAIVLLYRDVRADNIYVSPTTSESASIMITTDGQPVVATTTQWIANVTELTKFSTLELGTGTKKQICPENQFVYKCGNYRVGFDWLKSVKLPNPENMSQKVQTKNYYINDNALDLFNQMRNFFHDGDVKYKDDDGNIKTADVATYKEDRQVILQNLCNPLVENTGAICAKCPNDAKVKPSTVEVSEEDGKIIKYSWDFYTIADCYMNEFKDSTGSYEYVTNINDNDTKHDCYYTNTNPDAFNQLRGDSIANFAPGVTLNVSGTAAEVLIPTTERYTIDPNSIRYFSY